MTSGSDSRQSRPSARVSHRARPGHSLRRRRGAELCREHAGARTGAGDEPDDAAR
jgi:hypothetical protein